MKFYLGTDDMAFVNRVAIPWFVSVVRLRGRKKLLHGDWLLDSGGFTQIANHGAYTISEAEYLDVIERHRPALAFCQDWMCEAFILKKTGLTIEEHQHRTTASYLSMRQHTDRVRPVLQGWAPRDYAAHVRAYHAAGVDMSQRFGVGTVCSRNGDLDAIRWVLRAIHAEQPGIRLHGFGIKTAALRCGEIVGMLESADSMAWSARGRRTKLCGWCTKRSCAHCMEFALLWRRKVISQIGNQTQGLLAGVA
jgi:hypothetical protein